MRVSIEAAVVSAMILITLAVEAQVEPITIALIGDSTVADKSGWGKAFAGRFNAQVTVLNFAVGGRSSKSWYDDGRLPEALAAEPDYVLIQFGHNDQPGKGTERETDPATTYREYLQVYVKEFRSVGAEVIILSSVVRRNFDENGRINSTLTPWAEAAKAVAADSDVSFIDLHAASMDYHNRIGSEASMAFDPKHGDTTHLNQEGAEAITDLILVELIPVAKNLAAYLKRSNQAS